MKVSENWIDYECIDAGSNEKLERFGNVILRRPDPQAIWSVANYDKWNEADATYIRSEKGGGEWIKKNIHSDFWNIKYKDLIFKIGLTNFKHTGLFPEQAINWDYMIDKIKNSNKKPSVLNLFAYTGAATVACCKAGAKVVHVDSSKGMIEWAKDNIKLNKLENSSVRFIVDDCLKFVQREARRGNKYDAIIMDPPSFGRGPKGEIWKFENNIYDLINACCEILSDDALFFQINSYTTGISPSVLGNVLKINILNKIKKGKIVVGEIGLPIKRDNLILPCGIFGRWEI